jgi:hypothetical protein
MLVPGSREWWRWYREAMRFLARMEERIAPEYRRTRKAERPKCGAKCQDGTWCQAPAVWDRERNQPRNGRCRAHGGLSTGPRTVEGKRRSREGALRGAQVRAERRGSRRQTRTTEQ